MLLRSAVRARGAAWRVVRRPLGMLAAAMLAASVGGCASSPSNGQFALASLPTSNSAIAFESVDGPPPDVFARLVADLNDEAEARKVVMVSRSAQAAYHVRAYVSAIVERNRITYAWVWDVYDADKRRALRITGEEPGPPTKRHDTAGAWAGADERVVRRIAKSGMDQMAAFLSSPAPAEPAVPAQAAVTLVSARDDSPEAAGIIRASGDGQQQAVAIPPATAEAPLPSDEPRPVQKKKATSHPAMRSASASVATDGRAISP